MVLMIWKIEEWRKKVICLLPDQTGIILQQMARKKIAKREKEIEDNKNDVRELWRERYLKVPKSEESENTAALL